MRKVKIVERRDECKAEKRRRKEQVEEARQVDPEQAVGEADGDDP